MGSGCLDDVVVLALAEERLPAPLLVAASYHVRACAECRARIAAVTARSREVVTELLGPRRERGTERVGHSRKEAPRRSELAAGAPIGRYTVLGLVGRGGMGEVYAAYDPSLDRKVALKLMLDDAYASDRHAQERLVREAQAIAKLSHPNVVVVHDVDTFHGRVFVAMEFVDGVTLSDWLQQEERPWQDIVSVYLQAARGLSAAHRAGLVHRDFKPQNVMVASDGSVRVMDFGLARRIGPDGDAVAGAPREGGAPTIGSDVLTRTGEYLGTPLYMAPEQFVGGAIDASADQFSFCVSLFWALYGVHPFGARAGPAPATDGPVDVARSSTGAPLRLQRALVRGLSVDPAARWPSMDELAAALTRDPTRRRRNVALAAAGIAGCVVAGTLMARVTDGRRALCADGVVHLAKVWELPDVASRGASRREDVHGAIIKAGAADGPRIWDRVSTLLDAHVKSWLTTYRDACEATNVRHEQSPEILDVRMACLNDNLDATRALTDLLAVGDPRVVEHAAEAAAMLEDLHRCSDVQQLRLGVRPPKDPIARARVAALRKRMSDVNALFETGNYVGAASAAKALLADAKPLNYCPLEAEILVVEGEALSARSPAAGQPLLEEAIPRAESCGHDRIVARAAAGLVEFYLVRDPSRADRMADLARGALERAGGDVRLEGWLANNVGNLRSDQGRLDEAKQQYEHAIELKKLLLGPEHIDVAVSETNLADLLNELGRNDDALALVDRALAVERRPGSGSYFLSNALMSRGHILADLGRLAESEAEFRRAIALLGGGDSDDDPQWAAAAMGLGEVLERRGDDRQAVHYLERALRQVVWEARFRIADGQFSLARALSKIDSIDPMIRALASQAAATFAQSPFFEQRRRAVAEWLARQPASRAARSSAARKLSGRAAPVPAMSNAVP
jgi:tetratricopeptide (TPR) repeat protein/tRNA A-37 threonylcarbamoyl transferase component Bud32